MKCMVKMGQFAGKAYDVLGTRGKKTIIIQNTDDGYGSSLQRMSVRVAAIGKCLSTLCSI